MRPLERRQHLKEVSRGLSASALADALDGQGIWGCIHPRVRRLNPGKNVLFGQAYTVHWAPTRKTQDIKAPGPSTWSEVEGFLAPQVSRGEGMVYVGGSGRLVTEMALAGGLSCSYFEKIGFEGVVLGGAVRDATLITSLGIPVFASNFTPADTQGAYRIASVGQTTTIQSLVIRTGDWLFGDDSGVVVIPDALVDAVFEKALEIERVDASILKRINIGESLHDIVSQKEGRI